MSEVRPFARNDREQLRELVSAHAGTATPGGSIPTATLLNQLERPLGEYIVGPWVTDLATFVAVERDRIVGAAHLRRYADDERASESYRNAGEIVWLLCWPNHLDAGRAVRDRALDHLAQWDVRIWYGDGTLPAPGVYGVSDTWPHVQLLFEEAGFDASRGQAEIVYVGTLDRFPEVGSQPMPGLGISRQLGPLATAFNAVLGGQIVGSYEVDQDLTRGGTNIAFAGWADECNHWVREDLRGKGIGTWLVAHAALWLRLGGHHALHGIRDRERAHQPLHRLLRAIRPRADQPHGSRLDSATAWAPLNSGIGPMRRLRVTAEFVTAKGDCCRRQDLIGPLLSCAVSGAMRSAEGESKLGAARWKSRIQSRRSWPHRGRRGWQES